MFKLDRNLFPSAPREVSPKPYTADLNGLIAWLETQDGATEYEYMDCGGACLMGQFYKVAAPDKHWSDLYGKAISTAANVAIAQEQPHTFGAAKLRAIAYRDGGAA